MNLRLSPLDGARFLAGVVRAEYERTRLEGDPDVPAPGGPALDPVDVAEARCGGTERTVRRGKHDVVLEWGRKRRTPTRTLMRIIFERDRCCRVPGCGRTRPLHAHHVRFVSHGGTTDPDNLILLCSTHHRALHRAEFSIRALGGQQFSLHRSDGSIIDEAPPMRAPGRWQPDRTIDDDAVLPINPGRRLDLGYTTEVLHAVWAWKVRDEAEQSEAVALEIPVGYQGSS